MTDVLERMASGPRTLVSPLAPRSSWTLSHRLGADDCARWVRGVYEARAAWTADFDEQQFTLGRAFYTHLEQGKSKVYFDDAAASDARVECHAPGLQAAMRAIAEDVVAGTVMLRPGWCGAGIHVFPVGREVACRGGVIHYDTEGLSRGHIAGGLRAVTIVAMLQPPDDGGGLRVWDVFYSGRDQASRQELRAPSVVAHYGIGEVIALDSYRLHQIQPFAGKKDRVSATLHLAEIDDGRWEAWF